MREEIDSGKQARLRSPVSRRRRALKLCDMLDCGNYAKPGESYCLDCLRSLGSRLGVPAN